MWPIAFQIFCIFYQTFYYQALQHQTIFICSSLVGASHILLKSYNIFCECYSRTTALILTESSPHSERCTVPVTSQAVDRSANTFKLHRITPFTLQKLAQIASDSQSQFPLLYFTQSCNLQFSICLTISSNTVYWFHYAKPSNSTAAHWHHSGSRI